MIVKREKKEVARIVVTRDGVDVWCRENTSTVVRLNNDGATHITIEGDFVKVDTLYHHDYEEEYADLASNKDIFRYIVNAMLNNTQQTALILTDDSGKIHVNFFSGKKHD
jgi:hypothetical protein